MSEPAQVFRVGEILCEELIARGITTPILAEMMGGDVAIDNVLIDLIIAVDSEGMTVDDETLRRIAAALDVSPDFFVNIEKEWLRHPQKRSKFTAPESVFGDDQSRHYQLSMNK